MDATATRRLLLAPACLPGCCPMSHKPTLLGCALTFGLLMRLLDPSTHDLQVLARFQARCLVHVIEVGYCAESSSFRELRLWKVSQHESLSPLCWMETC